MNKEIKQIEQNSIAARLGISAGDWLVGINGKPINDVFDYRFEIMDASLELNIRKKNGEYIDYQIRKNEYDDLGLIFDTGLMDNAKNCVNKCVFCFIDQLPKKMRDSLYFKDDDARLSFLHGNYVTLTNMKRQDLERIAYYHLSPINVSVHSTERELRVFMLKNPAASDIIEQLETLRQANIEMNFQIVLCKDINDKQHLDTTITDLSRFMPNAKSLSVVPAGLTDFRQGLHHIEGFTERDAFEVIMQIEKWQNYFYNKFETRFVYAADEFYLKARLDIPPYDNYEDFPQLENGVGMLRIFEDEFNKALSSAEYKGKMKKSVSIVTGEASYEFMKRLADKFMMKFTGIKIMVYAAANTFFGKEITVSGLLTGSVILSRLKDCQLGDMLLVPSNALRAQDMEDKIFLDDVRLEELERRLGVPVIAVRNSGYDLINILTEE